MTARTLVAAATLSLCALSAPAPARGGVGDDVSHMTVYDAGIAQFWTVPPSGGAPVQVTQNPHPVASAFTWHPDGRRVTFVMDNCVCVTDIATGVTTRLTARTGDATAPRPEACVFSPDGSKVAFVRRLPVGAGTANQICVVECPPLPTPRQP